MNDAVFCLFFAGERFLCDAKSETATSAQEHGNERVAANGATLWVFVRSRELFPIVASARWRGRWLLVLFTQKTELGPRGERLVLTKWLISGDFPRDDEAVLFAVSFD